MHEAFFFGPIERQLFAVYHPPSRAVGQTLTIVCPPIFTEYIRTHSILRKLSISLAAQGQHVIRLDYSGTGDSSGSLDKVTLSDWVADIQLAVQEGVDLTGCRKVRVLGVRFGALLACMSVSKIREIERLVLWDPVCEGAEYFRSLQSGWDSTLESNLFIDRGDRIRAMRGHSVYNLSETLREGIMSLTASAYTGISSDKLRVVRTESSVEFPLREVPEEIVSANCQWTWEAEDVIMSQPILESLASKLIEK